MRPEILIQTLALMSWDPMALAEVAAGLDTIYRDGILTESADGHMFPPVEKEREGWPFSGE